MVAKINMTELLALSPNDRLELIEALWDSLSVQDDAVPVTEAQRRLLEERLAAYKADGNPGEPWEDFVARISKPK